MPDDEGVPARYLVTVTASTEAEASRLGRAAVERRLAACAQVSGPIASVYWWDGEVTSAQEWMCTMKTTAPRLGELTDQLRSMHSYDTPEIVATPIVAGDAHYLAWVDAETLR
jgi:periplasmic divalent cation tolerance protein